MTANHRPLDTTDIALIEKVKSTATLYDCSSPDFKFAYRKEQMWQGVASALGMAAVDARKRWTCLRDRYSRELKQMRLHPNSTEYGTSDFFRQMDFLRKFVRKRRERRRAGSKFKYDSSWEGSNDDVRKMLNRSRRANSEDNSFPDSQNHYETKLEAETGTDIYPEFVEVENQINETYEDYEEPQHLEEPASPRNNYAEEKSPRHADGNALSPTQNILPVTFVNHSAANATSSGANNNCSFSAAYKSSNPHYPNESLMISTTSSPETEDDFFCKTIGSYLRQLSRRHKIKAKVEMFQILEKYIDLEENSDACREEHKG